MVRLNAKDMLRQLKRNQQMIHTQPATLKHSDVNPTICFNFSVMNFDDLTVANRQ